MELKNFPELISMIVAHIMPCYPVKLKTKRKTKDDIAEQITAAELFKQGTF